MPFSFFDHTGDIGVRLEGATPDALFRSASDAFAESITDATRLAARETRTAALASSALDLLLVDFLGELLYLFEVDEFLVANADVRLHPGSSASQPLQAPHEADDAAWQLQAELHGERFDPERHPIKVLVKAVTYHALEVSEHPDGWHATVVFDI